MKSSANCHLNGLSRCQRYCHSMWRHGNFRFATLALKGGVMRAPTGCSINVFSAAVNGCEREHLNRFDRSTPCRKWSSANLFLTKTGKLPSRSPLWWDGSLLLSCVTSSVFFFSRDWTYRSICNTNFSDITQVWCQLALTLDKDVLHVQSVPLTNNPTWSSGPIEIILKQL